MLLFCCLFVCIFCFLSSSISADGVSRRRLYFFEKSKKNVTYTTASRWYAIPTYLPYLLLLIIEKIICMLVVFSFSRVSTFHVRFSKKYQKNLFEERT